MSRREDAEQTCHALHRSGQLLLYQDKAYLRPAEVAEMVLQALPDTTKDLEDKLTILHRELQPLEDVKKDVDKHAHMWGLHSCISCPGSQFLHVSLLILNSYRASYWFKPCDEAVASALTDDLGQKHHCMLLSSIFDMHRRSNMVLWGGLAGVMAVWGVCFRLTFWELSWDVMEPITYFIGSGTGKCLYPGSSACA